MDGQPSREDMVSYIVDPLLKIFISRRWEEAALNRWTGVIRSLKRLVLGSILNGILPESLAGLSDRMDLTESKVDALLKEYHAKVMEGRDVGDGGKWLMRCKEVARLSAFFRLPERRWQLGVVLVLVSAPYTRF